MISRRRLLPLLLAGVLSTLAVASADARPWRLDRTFGARGLQVTPINVDDQAIATALAVQTDGRVIVGGTTRVGDADAWMLVRYTTTGRLDPTFGTGGRVVAAVGSTSLASVSLLRDGTIVAVGGGDTDDGPAAFVARFTRRGRPDGRFGAGGVVRAPLPLADGSIAAVARAPDGRILVAALEDAAADDPVAVFARFTARGATDRGFGRGGIVRIPGANPAAVLAAPGGRMIAAYTRMKADGEGRVYLRRLRPSGRLDRAYGTAGVAATVSTADLDSGIGLIGGAGGSLLVTADTDDGVALARLSRSGHAERGFGQAGRMTLAMPDVGAVATLAGRRILLAADRNYVLRLVRLGPRGRYDTGFGAHGSVTLRLTAGGILGVHPFAMVAQRDGRVLIAGAGVTNLIEEERDDFEETEPFVARIEPVPPRRRAP